MQTKTKFEEKFNVEFKSEEDVFGSLLKKPSQPKKEFDEEFYINKIKTLEDKIKSLEEKEGTKTTQKPLTISDITNLPEPQSNITQFYIIEELLFPSKNLNGLCSICYRSDCPNSFGSFGWE